MEIRHKSVSELTSMEYRACYRANFGPWHGYMSGELVRCRKGYPGEVIMLWDGPDDTTRSLLGWTLLTPVRKYGEIAVTPWVMKRSKYTAMFWVKKQHRLKGYGKILMTEVKKLDPRPHVMPHNSASSELFSSFEVQVLGADKHWLKRKPKVA